MLFTLHGLGAGRVLFAVLEYPGAAILEEWCVLGDDFRTFFASAIL